MTDWRNDPEYLAMLRRVLETPEDDAPRWIIADRIEELDDPEHAAWVRKALRFNLWYQCGYGVHGQRCLEIDLVPSVSGGEYSRITRSENLGLPSADEQPSFIDVEFLWPEPIKNLNLGDRYRVLHGTSRSSGILTHMEMNEQKMGRFIEFHYLLRLQQDKDGLIECAYLRGFVDSIALPCAEFMQHAEQMFRMHPITSVWLTDLEPLTQPIVGFTCCHIWYKSGRDEGIIPEAIFDHMAEPKSDFAGRYCLDLDDAHLALSNACVRYGRMLAELPPIRLKPEQSHTVGT